MKISIEMNLLNYYAGLEEYIGGSVRKIIKPPM